MERLMARSKSASSRRSSGGTVQTLNAFVVAAIAVVFSLSIPLPGRSQSQAGLAAPLVFEVASVKQNKERGQGRLRYSHTGIDFADVPLPWVIGEAYHVPYSRISTPDSRLRELLLSGTYFFDIGAKVEREVTREQIQQMLQMLLADRFKLAL